MNLNEIRDQLLKCAESGDMLGVKFAINNLDTHIYKNQVGIEWKIGDKLKICEFSGHEFDNNEIVTIIDVEEGCYLCSNGIDKWYINKGEAVLWNT